MQSANGSKSTPVTFRFKNIGPVKEADMELGDLTIIAGRNNTGKTYLAYTLYGFLKTWREWADIRFSIHRSVVDAQILMSLVRDISKRSSKRAKQRNP